MALRLIRSIIEQQEVLSVPDTMTVCEVARLMKEKQAGATLIMEGDSLAGIFTERDALFRVVSEGRDAKITRVAEVMTRSPRTIHPDKPFSDALQLMHEGGFRHVPVVENGRPVGMISTSDALGSELQDFVYELLRQEQAQDVLSG